MTNAEYIKKYLDLGFSIHLIKPRQKVGIVGHIYQGTAGFTIETDCNIAIRLGGYLPTPNVSEDLRVVHCLDFDTFPGYEAWAAANPEMVQTPTQMTHRGMHVFFTLPYQSRNAKGPGLDLIGDEWYALVQPSIHPEGTHYTWLHNPFYNLFVHLDNVHEMKGIDWNNLNWEPDDYDDDRGEFDEFDPDSY